MNNKWWMKCFLLCVMFQGAVKYCNFVNENHWSMLGYKTAEVQFMRAQVLIGISIASASLHIIWASPPSKK